LNQEIRKKEMSERPKEIENRIERINNLVEVTKQWKNLKTWKFRS